MKDNLTTPQDIGHRISAARTKLNLTQEELANRIGVARGIVNYWEKGAREIKSTDLVLLSQELHTSCDYLLKGIHTENLTIAKETGLTNDSIENLKELHSDYKRSQSRMEALNFLLSCDNLDHFLDDIEEYLTLVHSSRDIQLDNERIIQKYIPNGNEIKGFSKKVKMLPPDIQPIYFKNTDQLKENDEGCKYRLFRLQNTLTTLMEKYTQQCLKPTSKRK